MPKPVNNGRHSTLRRSAGRVWGALIAYWLLISADLFGPASAPSALPPLLAVGEKRDRLSPPLGELRIRGSTVRRGALTALHTRSPRAAASRINCGYWRASTRKAAL